MELLILALGAGALWFFVVRAQHRRIRLLAGVLGKFQVEKMMETVADGYLRALGESNAERSQQVWNMLGQAEVNLSGQIQTFVAAFDAVDAQDARFSTLPFAVPFALELFANASADLRALLHIHARGVEALVRNAEGLSQKDKAYRMTAEILLLQHSCQWYCRSKASASARVMARHRTPYGQLLASVSQQTRNAYQALLD
jgi:hypothetical protein